MKRKLFFFNFILILFLIFPLNFVFAVSVLDSPNVSAPVTLLMEADSGRVLFENNGFDKRFPASTTKMLTAILVLENCDLDDSVTVTNSAISQVPSGYVRANVKAGEVFSVEELLYAFLVPSANDIGFVFAEHVSGSTENFAVLMNSKADEIGCKNSHFTNPCGLQDVNHYSCAYDLALIARYAMKNDVFRNVVSTQAYSLRATSVYSRGDREFVNTNFLIREDLPRYYFKYATGIKTGFTDEAKECVVASAKKDGIEYIAVVLGAGLTADGSKERFVDAKTLLEFGFNNYTINSVCVQGKVFDKLVVPDATSDTENLDVLFADSIDAFMAVNDINKDWPRVVSYKDDLKAPIAKGDVIGSVSFSVDDMTYSTDLIAASDVEKSYLWLYILIAVCVFFFIVVCFVYASHKKKIKSRKRNYRR